MNRVRVGAPGRTVIPAALRAQAGIQEGGDVLVGHVEGGRLIVESRTAVWRRLRELAAACRAEGVVDRLLADRAADLDEALGMQVVPFLDEDAKLLVEVRCTACRQGARLSLADCWCLATGIRLDLPVVGGNQAWEPLQLGVEVLPHC